MRRFGHNYFRCAEASRCHQRRDESAPSMSKWVCAIRVKMSRCNRRRDKSMSSVSRRVGAIRDKTSWHHLRWDESTPSALRRVDAILVETSWCHLNQDESMPTLIALKSRCYFRVEQKIDADSIYKSTDANRITKLTLWIFKNLSVLIALKNRC